MNPYSGSKVLFHGKRLEALRDGRVTTPVHVQFIISDLCNHDCSFCAYRMSGYASNALFAVVRDDGSRNNNPNRMIDAGKCLDIINECWMLGVKAIQFTGGGEPTVHPAHETVFAHALHQGIQCALVSNGQKWSERLIRDILPAFAWVRVSVDAGCAATHAKVRRIKPTVFAGVWRNIEALAATPHTNPEFRLGVGFVVTAENYREVIACAKLARDAGADNMRIGAMFSPEGESYYRPFMEEASELCAEASALSTEEFTVHNLFPQRVGDLTQHAPDYELCGFQHFTTYIGADLNVYRCCNTAYNERGLLGSIAGEQFHEFWESTETQRRLREFNARGCDLCQFHDKNRAIAAAVEPTIHQHFV